MARQLGIVHALEKNRLQTGSVVQMVEAAVGLSRRGHHVQIISRSGGDLEQVAAAAGVPLFALPLRHEFDVGSALQLRRLLRSSTVDVIHVHKGRPHAVALMAAAGLGPLPVVVVNRGVSFPLDAWNKWKYRHRRVGAVVCVAEAIRQVMIASGGLRPQLVHTIHAGTDTARFDPSVTDRHAVRQELGLGSTELVVCQVSVRDWKGWRELLAAFAHVTRRQPLARLLLVGCEPERVRLAVMAEAERLGVARTVLALPYRRDMPAVLAACDIVVDASWAGTGITGTIREAMAMQRAVVATNCAGNRELVTGDVGLLVPPKEVAALGAALDRLLADAAFRRRLGTAARQRVVASFSTRVRLDRLESLYHRLVEARAERAS